MNYILQFQEVESGNESAPEQLSRENSAIDFSHTHDQTQKTSTSRDSDNQYKVYFYDPKESSSDNIPNSTGAIGDTISSHAFPQTACKRGDVSGYIMIGMYNFSSFSKN